MKTIRLKGGEGYERGKNIDSILVSLIALPPNINRPDQLIKKIYVKKFRNRLNINNMYIFHILIFLYNRDGRI